MNRRCHQIVYTSSGASGCVTRSSPSLFHLELLGPVRVSATGVPRLSLISQPRRLALLAYLALARPRGLHSRDTLIALLWPESNQKDGRHALRNALHAIRKALRPEAIVAEGDDLVGVDSSLLLCDAITLETEIARGDSLSLTRLDATLMEGFHVSDAPEFEWWMDAERRRFDEVVLSASWSLCESLERRGDGEAAVTTARWACGRAPYDERSLRRLIELLDKRGESTAAVQEYERYAARLERELGVAPSPAIVRLAGNIRARHSNGQGDSSAITLKTLPTKDPSTYIQYVRGTYLFLRAAHSGNANDLEQGRAMFEAALQRDPNFALAHAGLSNYFAVAAARNLLRPFDATFTRAIEMSQRALELDPSLAIPHVHFGVKAMYLDQDWDAAGREFSLAVTNDPSYAEARRFYGIWLDVVGRGGEALTELREAVRLEPQIPMVRNTLAAALMDRGEWASALSELKYALETDPGYMAARERFVRCAEEMGLYDAAFVERTRAPAIGDVNAMRAAFDKDGVDGYRRVAREELLAQLAALEARFGDGPSGNAGDLFNPPELRLAVICARLGEWDAAARWEESACGRRPGLRPWFRSRPELNVRSTVSS